MFETVLFALTAAAIGGAIAFLSLSYLVGQINDRLAHRLADAVERTHLHPPDSITLPKVGGILGLMLKVARRLRQFRPVGAIVARLSSPGRRRAAAAKLDIAGWRDRMTPDDLIEAQVMGALTGFGILLMAGGFSLRNIGLGLLVGGVMYRLTLVPLTNAGQTRQSNLRGELSKAADIFVVAVEAGMTLDKAMSLYAERFPGPLSDELRRIDEDIKVGKRRQEAYKAAMHRADLDDLTKFLSAILLAERFGVPVAMVLRDQSEELKKRRTQRIREASMRAPVKMLVPTVALILPALFVVLLGPVAIIVASGGLF
jgi:tight adherence protein C